MRLLVAFSDLGAQFCMAAARKVASPAHLGALCRCWDYATDVMPRRRAPQAKRVTSQLLDDPFAGPRGQEQVRGVLWQLRVEVRYHQ